jgi:uncharacterized protein YbbK (DUF523 family)
MLLPLDSADRIVVSACLLGERCRYDGAVKPSLATQRLVEACEQAGVTVVSVCPEILGGLPFPRPGAGLHGGDGHMVLAGQARVLTVDARVDCTKAFCEGARQAFRLAGAPRLAILKARSPSCGFGRTLIDGSVQAGDGVLAAMLRQAEVPCLTDEDVSASRSEIGIRRDS